MSGASPSITTPGNGRNFFVEVGVDDGRGQAVVLRSFSDSAPLADYAQGV